MRNVSQFALHDRCLHGKLTEAGESRTVRARMCLQGLPVATIGRYRRILKLPRVSHGSNGRSMKSLAARDECEAALRNVKDPVLQYLPLPRYLSSDLERKVSV
jgi:hypothetical protein